MCVDVCWGGDQRLYIVCLRPRVVNVYIIIIIGHSEAIENNY